MTQQLRTMTEVVAAADHLSRLCQDPSADDPFGEDGEREVTELFARNGLSQAQRDTLCDRTRQKLERSKVFLSLVGG